MKKIITMAVALAVVFSAITLTGCGETEKKTETDVSSSISVSDSSREETEGDTEHTTESSADSKEEVGGGTGEAADGSHPGVGESTEPSAEDDTTAETTDEGAAGTTIKTTEGKTTTKPTGTRPPTTTRRPNPPKTTNSPEKTDPPTTTTTQPTEWYDNSLYDRIDLLEKRIFYYINKYRAEEGEKPAVWLDGMAELAKDRSKQLPEDFNHDAWKEVLIEDKHKYGVKYDYDGRYRFDDGGEIGINMAGVLSSNVDAEAAFIVGGFHSSPPHWNEMKSYARNPFISVGCTYDQESGLVYTSVFGASTDEFEK